MDGVDAEDAVVEVDVVEAGLALWDEHEAVAAARDWRRAMLSFSLLAMPPASPPPTAAPTVMAAIMASRQANATALRPHGPVARRGRSGEYLSVVG